MLTKVAVGLAAVLTSASVSLAATHIQSRNDSQTIYNPAPSVAYPVDSCDIRVPFPSCSGGGL